MFVRFCDISLLGASLSILLSRLFVFSFFFLLGFGRVEEIYTGGKIGRGPWLGVVILVGFEGVGWFFFSFLFFLIVGVGFRSFSRGYILRTFHIFT